MLSIIIIIVVHCMTLKIITFFFFAFGFIIVCCLLFMFLFCYLPIKFVYLPFNAVYCIFTVICPLMIFASIRFWDLMILMPNGLFLAFLICQFRDNISKLRLANSPIFLAFYGLVCFY